MKRKQWILLVLKALLAAAVVFWLFRRVDIHRVWHTIVGVRLLPAVAGLALGLLTIVIAGWRWQRELANFDIAIPLRALVCIVQIGQFFAVFLPGPIGDDLTRILYVSRLAPNRVAEACTAVIVDRAMGLCGIVLLAAVCTPWQWPIMATSAQTRWIAIAILSAGAMVSLAGLAFFAAGHPTHRWFEKRLRSGPAQTARDEIARIWGLLCDNKLSVAKVLGAAAMTQAINCVLFYFAGVSIGIDRPLLLWLTFVPIVLAASALPISIAGIGVREYLLVLFLAVVAGVDGEQALAASLVVFAIILAICLLGGVLYIFYKPKPAAVDVWEPAQPA
jgi:hypothetical protein